VVTRVNTTAAVTFAVVLPALLVAHNVADHWVQRHHDAIHKGAPGWVGRRACASHVAGYTVVTALVTGLVWWVFALPISPVGFVAGQVVSALDALLGRPAHHAGRAGHTRG
jgi:Na+/H+-translocating membrane pyrophosphatase